MTDLYLYPTAHHVDVALSTADKLRRTVTQRRTIKCTAHCHGQFDFDKCPYCQRKEAPPLHVSLQQKKCRVAARAAALEIIEQQPPSSLSEFAARIKERCGTELTPTQVGDMLQKLRDRGYTTFYIKPERALRLRAASSGAASG